MSSRKCNWVRSSRIDSVDEMKIRLAASGFIFHLTLAPHGCTLSRRVKHLAFDGGNLNCILALVNFWWHLDLCFHWIQYCSPLLMHNIYAAAIWNFSRIFQHRENISRHPSHVLHLKMAFLQLPLQQRLMCTIVASEMSKVTLSLYMHWVTFAISFKN